jgi:hypothetical protein
MYAIINKKSSVYFGSIDIQCKNIQRSTSFHSRRAFVRMAIPCAVVRVESGIKLAGGSDG